MGSHLYLYHFVSPLNWKYPACYSYLDNNNSFIEEGNVAISESRNAQQGERWHQTSYASGRQSPTLVCIYVYVYICIYNLFHFSKRFPHRVCSNYLVFTYVKQEVLIIFCHLQGKEVGDYWWYDNENLQVGACFPAGTCGIMQFTPGLFKYSLCNSYYRKRRAAKTWKWTKKMKPQRRKRLSSATVGMTQIQV